MIGVLMWSDVKCVGRRRGLICTVLNDELEWNGTIGVSTWNEAVGVVLWTGVF